MRSVIITLLIVMLPACATISNNTATQSAKPIPEQDDRSTINQLGKGDSDRMADVEVRENTESLRLLMLKLYKRNPHELQKSTPDVAERMVDWVLMVKHSIITNLNLLTISKVPKLYFSI